MRRGEIVMAGLLALFALYLMWKSAELPVGYLRGRGPGGGAWPFWLSGIMLLCCGAIALRWWRRESPPAQSDEPMLDSYGWRTLLQVGGGIVAFVALIDVFSMYGAIFLFLFYYIRFLGRHGLALSLAISLITPVALFFFFEGAMLIPMPQGMAFTQPVFDLLYDILY